MRTFASMCSLLVFALFACTADDSGDDDSAAGGSETDSTDSDATGSETNGETEGDDGSACGEDGGLADFSSIVTVPPLDPPPSEESGMDSRSATCIVDGVAQGAALTLALTCDEDGGLAGQSYTVEFIAPEGEQVGAIEQGSELVLDYQRWWGFEFGSGTGVSLRSGDDVVLLAYRESTIAGSCAMMRAESNSWLARVGAQLVETDCEPEGVHAVAIDDDDATPLVFRGQVATIPSGQRMVLEQALCFEEEGREAGFAAWRGS